MGKIFAKITKGVWCMGSHVYTGNVRISYYDLDMYGTLKLSALLRIIHIAADINATELGVGFSSLSKHDMTFILQRIGFKFTCFPGYNQNVKVSTWPAEVSRGTFLRQGVMESEAGEKMIEWASLWILFDIGNRKIMKPNQLPAALPSLSGSGVEISPKKIALPGELGSPSSSYTHFVRYGDTDTNMHMNNSVYGDVIGNALQPIYAEKPFSYNEIQINYLLEAKLGTTIEVSAWQKGESIYVQGLTGGKQGFVSCHTATHTS